MRNLSSGSYGAKWRNSPICGTLRTPPPQAPHVLTPVQSLQRETRQHEVRSALITRETSLILLNFKHKAFDLFDFFFVGNDSLTRYLI